LLNYDNIAYLVPVATNLVNSKYETHILTGLFTILNILKQFGEPMIQIKTVPVGRGVDLAREQRIEKVDACIDALFKFSESKGFQKARTR